MPLPHKPDFRIVVDGRRDITETVRDRLLSLSVTDEAGEQSDSAEIQLDDRDRRIQRPRRGVALEISLGWDPQKMTETGRYTVDEVNLQGPPDVLVIRARGADMLAGLKVQKSRSWDDVSIGDLVGRIAADHGLEPRVGASLRGVRIPHLDQTDESDLHLLTRLGRDHDAVAKPAAGRLLFMPQGQALSATGREMPVVKVGREHLRSWRVTLADRSEYRSARAHWREPGAAVRRTETAGAGEPAYTLRRLHASASEAAEAARAKLAELTRGTNKLSATFTLGVPVLAVEAALELEGFRPDVDGLWVCRRVVHRLDRGGYTTTAEAELKGD